LEKFRIAKDSVDPSKVPQRKLSSGDFMPGIGIGTFGSDSVSDVEVAKGVKEALTIGFRLLDCAACYGNEKLIGDVISDALDSGEIKRHELFIASKVWNDMHGSGDVPLACEKTLKDLRLDYLDMYFVHWPFPNYHPPGCDSDARNPDSVPYIHENFMETWRQMESLVKSGLVRNIGVSNVTIPKLNLILPDAHIKPTCNEMELHPHFQQQELFDFCVDNDIQPVGFSPIGSPARPERDKVSDDTVATEDPVIIELARKYNVHPAIICIRWALQRGQIPIPFSVKRDKLLANIRCVIDMTLTEDEMAAIAKIDKNCRLIKGQVFLWEHAKGWEDLWDLDGVIAK